MTVSRMVVRRRPMQYCGRVMPVGVAERVADNGTWGWIVTGENRAKMLEIFAAFGAEVAMTHS